MEVIQTELPGVIVIKPRVFGDARGFFLESFRAERYRDAGIELDFVQDNHSRSAKGVLRGLHCQARFVQGKLVRVSKGKVFDVAVDIRWGSPHFGQWFGTILDDETHTQMYIPPGFAHGFCVLSDVADFQYKCTEIYHPEDEIGVRWDDPDLAIKWPVENPLISDRDSRFPFLRDILPEVLPRSG